MIPVELQLSVGCLHCVSRVSVTQVVFVLELEKWLFWQTTTAVRLASPPPPAANATTTTTTTTTSNSGILHNMTDARLR